MSLEPGSRGQSPMHSGRSSPQIRRKLDEDPTRKDPRYKRFSANIDRALALFESNTLQEWADYISFLGRLLKALQSHPSLPHVPSKSIVAMRLSQCLNPRLPSGVHQKTIEVYAFIFSLIGRDGLSSDLTLWTPGLMPVLSYASLTLKPHYLNLLETFFLPLGADLRPALRALILALLPGIDEEGGEYFDRTLALIEGIRARIHDDAYFWQCFFLAVITAQARRQGALSFLGRQLPSFSSTPLPSNGDKGMKVETAATGADAIMNPEPGLLIRAFCAGLNDDQILVQRGFLDLLVSHIPLSSEVLQKSIPQLDLELLVTSAAGVVLRRDMSLNRRLWAWFLGPEEGQARSYFEKYGLTSLVGGLKKMLIRKGDISPTERARPYRIGFSLMDRWEVGSLVVPKLFNPAIDSLREYEQSAPSTEAYMEAVRSASMFFDGVEAGLIWRQILNLINSAFSTKNTNDNEELDVVRFIIKTFNVKEDEMVLIHVPMAVLAILEYMNKGSAGMTKSLREKGFSLAEELWELVPDGAFRRQSSTSPIAVRKESDEEQILITINQFYERLTTRSPDSPVSSPFPLRIATELILKDVSSSVQRLTGSDDIAIPCRLLISILKKLPRVSHWPEGDAIVLSFLNVLQSHNIINFSTLNGIANVIAAMLSKEYLDTQQTDAIVLSLTKALWTFLSPDRPKFHVETVKALWTLQGVLGDRRIEAAIATVMTGADLDGVSGVRDVEQGKRFGVLWTHSVNAAPANGYHMVLTRPLLLFLDCLSEDELEMTIFACAWLQNVASVNKVFWILATKLLGCEFLRDPGQRSAEGAPLNRRLFNEDDHFEIATYYFQTLVNILKYATNNVLVVLGRESIVVGDEEKAKLLSANAYGEEDMTYQELFAKAALRAVDSDAGDKKQTERVSGLHRAALAVLHRLLLSQFSKPLAAMELENIITARLISVMDNSDSYVQVSLLDVLYAALKLSLERPTSHLGHLRQLSIESTRLRTGSRISLSMESEKSASTPQAAAPQQLLRCLVGGFSSPSSRPVLESWIHFLAECLPLIQDVIFQMLIPLVECLCTQIKLTFETLRVMFQEGGNDIDTGRRSPESTLVALLNGLEQILAAAHEKLLNEEMRSTGPKSPETQASAGFFGNMVSGVFSVESPHNRNSAANNRLTVLLCFQDTVKICYSIWSWGDTHSTIGADVETISKESWAYTSLRMRGRARRILEHMFAAETLECLEKLIELWPGKTANFGERRTGSIFRLVNVLDGSRPKHTMPAIFNAIYSRTNPSALDPNRRSTLTADLTDLDVVVFLVEYARSLEDDAMDEIWADTMVFLRDVLTNPFPHRQMLPSLLSFTATLGEKVDNTNFGEQRKMRKDLGDIFLRLLTAAFTVSPAGQRSLEPPPSLEKETDGEGKGEKVTKGKTTPDDIVAILVPIIPELRKVLVEPERVTSASISISTSIVGPTFRSKAFPQNVSSTLLDLVHQLMRLPNNQKAWKKDVSDALLDSKFFSSSTDLVKNNWIPLVRQYLLSDRERMVDLLGRITPPTTAGVLFGVGATSARQEADRKTQLNLRRIAFLILAANPDTFVINLGDIEEKLVELLSSTAVTSPSSVTRAEVYLVLRALALKTSSVHMAPFWPLINSELQSALMSLFPGEEDPTYNDQSILQACKLLDTLLVVAPDEFQLHEWLFVTDTIEAVYHPHDWHPVALVDQVAQELQGIGEVGVNRRPWFRGRVGEVNDIRRDEVAPFLKNLSIACYEGTYAMESPDIKSCKEGLLGDLFEED